MHESMEETMINTLCELTNHHTNLYYLYVLLSRFGSAIIWSLTDENMKTDLLLNLIITITDLIYNFLMLVFIYIYV